LTEGFNFIKLSSFSITVYKVYVRAYTSSIVILVMSRLGRPSSLVRDGFALSVYRNGRVQCHWCSMWISNRSDLMRGHQTSRSCLTFEEKASSAAAAPYLPSAEQAELDSVHFSPPSPTPGSSSASTCSARDT